MADIFVSYAREDREKIVPFVDLLEAQGWSVWWDRSIGPGVSFSKVIEREIAEVKCVIVFWSSHSVASDWVNAEANEGLVRNILIPVILEPVNVPLIFRQTQAADLTGWPTRASPHELQQLLDAASAVISKPVVELPATRRARLPWMKFGLGFGLVIILLIGFVLTNKSLQVTTPDKVIRQVPVEPVASIMVLPFTGMISDIAIEVAELLSRSGTIQVIVSDQLNKSSEAATYNLQAIQTGNQLLVSLFDNIKQQTKMSMEINLRDTSLDTASQNIANRIAREFNLPAVVKRQVVDNDLYMRYLQARSTLRQPLTDSTLSQSIESLLSIVASAPRFGEAQASLCLAYIESYRNTGETQDFESAEKHCFRASRLADTNPLVNIALGQLYKTAGQLDEATNSYLKALDTSPFLTEAMDGLAAVKLSQEDIEGAISLHRKAQHYEPKNWVHYNELGALYFRQGLYERAVEQYSIAKNLVTDQSLVLNDLGAVYFMLEDFENAIVNWEASLRLERTFSALSNLGSAYYFKQDFKQALTSYEQAIEINSRDYRMWLNAGEAAFHGKQGADRFYRQAIRLAEAQLKINPDEAEIQSALALCYASLGEAITARRHIDNALIYGGNDIYVLYDVAVAHARLGETSVMNETIQKMISIGYSPTLIDRDANFKS
jgi:tetratricopeptide (TPR) repeat protein